MRGVAHAQKQPPPNAISITVDNLAAKLRDDRLRCLEVSGCGVTILFGPPANIRYGLTVLIYNSGSLWAPFTVLGPWAPDIAGAADG